MAWSHVPAGSECCVAQPAGVDGLPRRRCVEPTAVGLFSAAAVSLLARHTGSVVTVATFTASAALVAFAMVASVATPELGQELSKAGELFNVVGRPVGWGLMMAPFALQTILAAFAAGKCAGPLSDKSADGRDGDRPFCRYRAGFLETRTT